MRVPYRIIFNLKITAILFRSNARGNRNIKPPPPSSPFSFYSHINIQTKLSPLQVPSSHPRTKWFKMAIDFGSSGISGTWFLPPFSPTLHPFSGFPTMLPPRPAPFPPQSGIQCGRDACVPGTHRERDGGKIGKITGVGFRCE